MLNPIALDKLNEWFGTCHKAMMGRNGTGGEPSQMLLNAVNAGVEFAAIAAAAVVIPLGNAQSPVAGQHSNRPYLRPANGSNGDGNTPRGLI